VQGEAVHSIWVESRVRRNGGRRISSPAFISFPITVVVAITFFFSPDILLEGVGLTGGRLLFRLAE
jgi:hypothetical protein